MALSQAFSSRNVTTHLPNVKKATELIARENLKLKWAHSLLIILYYYYVKKGTDLRKVLASSVKTSERYEVKTEKKKRITVGKRELQLVSFPGNFLR